MVTFWAKEGPLKKQGRKTNSAFELQVIGMLIYTRMERINGVEQALIEANVAHGYAVLKQAAEAVQKLPPFFCDTAVQKLKFTRPWAKGLLNRATLRRKRICAQDKELPTPAAVRLRMGQIQLVITGYTLDQRVNADETGVFFGAAPKNQFVPASSARAMAPETRK